MDGRIWLGSGGRLLVSRPPLPGESARLRALAGLPVPEVVDDADELVVTWLPPEDDPAGVAADVAAVLAAAHERGVAHGPLAPEHVRSGGVVDGWAGGDPASDVAELGRLLLDAGGLSPTAAALARRATADDPAVRPTMHAMAEALRPPSPAPPRRHAIRAQVPRWAPAAAAVPIAVAAVVLAADGAPPAVVAVDLRCRQASAPALLDTGSGDLRLDDGTRISELPDGCELVVRRP